MSVLDVFFIEFMSLKLQPEVFLILKPLIVLFVETESLAFAANGTGDRVKTIVDGFFFATCFVYAV